MTMRGDRVKQRRESLGWTQVELARRAGLSQGSIARIENGSTTDVRSGNQRALARALGVSDAFLLGESDLPELIPVQETRVERDPDAGLPDEAYTPFEKALFHAMDPEKFLPDDFDATRRAIRETFHLLKPEQDLVAMAREWLVAARQLRLEGHRVNTAAIATRVAVGRGAHAERVAHEVDTAARADADARARAMGSEPGRAAHVGKKLAGMMKKPRRDSHES